MSRYVYNPSFPDYLKELLESKSFTYADECDEQLYYSPCVKLWVYIEAKLGKKYHLSVNVGYNTVETYLSKGEYHSLLNCLADDPSSLLPLAELASFESNFEYVFDEESSAMIWNLVNHKFVDMMLTNAWNNDEYEFN